jgi:3-phenylpropionate/trans-cinnamate dioxygenase ferredoxin reductase subunit
VPGELIAIDSINQSPDHLTGRKLMDKGISPTPQQAADPACDLAALLA